MLSTAMVVAVLETYLWGTTNDFQAWVSWRGNQTGYIDPIVNNVCLFNKLVMAREDSMALSYCD